MDKRPTAWSWLLHSWVRSQGLRPVAGRQGRRWDWSRVGLGGAPSLPPVAAGPGPTTHSYVLSWCGGCISQFGHHYDR
uniref:Uncharacterized protein n=1 Tax=Gopherus agassizii TaxID=38772 RepID=A0A452HCG9_9SAUR